MLVATDFSAAATRAVERAARLPISPGSALTVLHVLRPGCRPEDRADAERALGYAASVAADSAARVGRKDVAVQAVEVVHAYEPVPESTIRRVGFSRTEALQYDLEAKREAQTAVETFLAAGDASPPAKIILQEGGARQVILDVATQGHADLLAVGTHGRSGLVHVLLGSVAEAVIRAANCDVLVARALGLPFKLP